jgi:hypothetical protein
MESFMQAREVNSGLETLRLAVPFIAVLGFGLFRLHTVLAAPRRFQARLHRLCGTCERSAPLLHDPYANVVALRRHGN